ncbi:hypothetical protein Tco_1010868 [Tanacetum coccineum]
MAENTVKEMTTKFGKLDKFEGHDFRRWQKKMHFLLTTLKVVYVLTTPMPELLEDDTMEAIRRRAKWENDDYICRGHILNGMPDPLFDIYQNVESAKELWDSLESKYIAKDASKENLRAQESDKGKGKEVAGPFVNMTKEGKNKNNKKTKKRNVVSMRTTVVLVPTRNQNCNVESLARLVTSIGIAVVVDAIAWWIDSGATNHVCKDRCWFKIYEPVEDGSVLYMGDDHFALVHEKGSVVLEFSSGTSITLFNVLYVPKLHKNLKSGPVLNKCGYKQVYESDKYILSKSGVFVGFGYYNNVVTKSGQVPVNTAKQSSPRAATSISTARPVNTAAPKPKVNDALPTTYSYFQAHSPVKKPINKRTAVTDINFNKKINTAKVNNVTTAGPKAVVSAAEGNGENAVKSSACWIYDQQEMLLTILQRQWIIHV